MEANIDYTSWSKEDLIEKIQQIEKEKHKPLVIPKQQKNQEEGISVGKGIKRIASPVGLPTRRENKRKKQKAFDFTKCNKRHVALKIAYLGWDYHGLAVQETAENTIEAHLFSALTRACLVENRETCDYQRCGRTDKGVSAFTQVLSLTIRSNLREGLGVIASKEQPENSPVNKEELPFARTLNSLLPPEIRVIAWAPVTSDFNARFSCSHRTYKYYFRRGDLNIESMQEAANRFVGEHDFRNLCKMDVTNGVVNYIRTVVSFQVGLRPNSVKGLSPLDDIYEFTIQGRAFLWHQVRCMVAILFLVGQGLESPDVVDGLLDTKSYPNRPYYNMAPDLPLCLYECGYEGVNWISMPDSHQRLVAHLESQWEHHALKAAMVRRMLDGLDEVPVTTKDGLIPWSQAKHTVNTITPRKHDPVLGRNAV
eukprot:Ihof_evm2s480 gene=Ihof_evmTU2s480